MGDVGAEEEMWVIGGELIRQDTFADRLKETDKTKMKGYGRKATAAYSVGGGDRLEVEFGQGIDNITGTLEEVFPYDRSESEKLFRSVAILVNNLHLLDYC